MDTTQLADPTDFGNKPGDGPLRQGGVAQNLASATRPENNLPSTRSKAAKRQLMAVTRARDLWAGQDAVHDKTTMYLPKNPAEEPSSYSVRLAMSTFFNFYRRAIEGLVGLVYRVDPELGEDVPPQIMEHWENIDLAGTHGDVFCRDVSTDAMNVGHAAILVEYPQTGGAQTAADERTGAIRPYWVPIMKENICSWRTSVRNGSTALDQIVLYENTMVPDGEYGEKEQKRYRVLKDTDGVVTFQVLEVTDDKRVILHDEGEYMKQMAIPISEVPTSGRRGLFDSDPPLNDVAHLNLAYYQQNSDMVTSMHSTVPFLLTLGMDVVDENGEPISNVEVGPNAALMIRDANGDAKWVAHTGQAIKDQKASLDEIKADIGTLSLAMLSPQKRMAETALARRLDKSQGDSALAVTARAWQDAFERCLGFHARYLGLDSGGSVVINRDFEGLLMEPDVMRAYAELLKVGFPKRVALEMLQQGGRIGQDVDLDELEMELMANEAAAEEQRQLDAEERMAALNGEPVEEAA